MKTIGFPALFVFLYTVVPTQCTLAQSLNSVQIGHLIDSVQQQFAPDKRTAIFQLELQESLNKTLILKGETNLPDAKQMLFNQFEEHHLQIIDSVKVLPGSIVGSKTWALTTLSVANVRSQPDHASELVSQSIMGTPMKVLDISDNWIRVQTPDLYIGWMEENGLFRIDHAELQHWKSAERYVFTQISGVVLDAPAKNANIVSDLVLGDLFVLKKGFGKFLEISLPDGRSGFVRKSDCISWQSFVNAEPDVRQMLKLARQMLGVPYLWGGTSSKMLDCSGFAKTAYFSQGIILARDASQQAQYGFHPDIKHPESLEAGDLLFFGRTKNRIIHVGIYIDKGKYIHASGMVRVNSIDPNDPAYNITEKKKLVAASRILNALNTKGIVQLKNHPWYVLPETGAAVKL